MECARIAVRVINGVVNSSSNSESLQDDNNKPRLLDKIHQIFPKTKILPHTLTDAIPLVQSLLDNSIGLFWLDGGYNSHNSDEGTLLTAPSHHCSPIYIGGDALGWYCSGFLPALVHLLLLGEKTQAMRNNNTHINNNTTSHINNTTNTMDRTGSTLDTLRLRWCAVRSFNTHVVDLIDPFVSSSVNNTLSPEINSDPNCVSTLRHLVLHSVRDFVQHVERVVVTPSFSTVRESLSHIFWFTQWGISYIVCIVQEKHTSVFIDLINSTLDLSAQEESPLSFLRTMQAVKVAIALNEKLFHIPNKTQHTHSHNNNNNNNSNSLSRTSSCYCCYRWWCFRIGAHQWNDPLDILALLQQLESGNTPPISNSRRSTVRHITPVPLTPSQSSLTVLTSEEIEEEKEREEKEEKEQEKEEEKEEEEVVQTINGIHVVNREPSHSTSSLLLSSLQGFETSIDIGHSSYYSVSHLKERLQLEEERLKQLTGELQQSKEHGVFLEHEIQTVEEKVSALRKEIQSLEHTIQSNGYNDNENNENAQTTIHTSNASIDSHHIHQGYNEQKYTLEDIKTHYKDVEEQMRRYYHTRKAALIHQREAEQARMESFTAEYTEKRRFEYEQAQGELQALQIDIKATQDEILRLQNEANMGNVPFLSISSNSHTSVYPIPIIADNLTENELDISRDNTSKDDKVFLSSLQEKKRELERMQLEMCLLQEEVDAERQLALNMASLSEKNKLQKSKKNQLQEEQCILYTMERRSLQFCETRDRALLESEYYKSLTLCWRDYKDIIKNEIIIIMSTHKKNTEKENTIPPQSTLSLSVVLQRVNEDYAMIQEEWEREEKQQVKRNWSMEDEIDTLVKYNTNLQQEVKTLQAKCSQKGQERREALAELEQVIQQGASQVFSRMTILLENLSCEERKESRYYVHENDNINSVQDKGGVHRALRIALLAGCHRPTGKTPRNRQSDTYPFSHVKARENNKKNKTFVQPLLQQQLQREEQQKACEYYLQLCEDLEERARLQAEEKRLSESCRVLETAVLETQRRIQMEQKTVRQLAAIATELEVLK